MGNGGLVSFKSRHFLPKSYVNPANESLAAALSLLFCFFILQIKIMLLLGFYEEKFVLVFDQKNKTKLVVTFKNFKPKFRKFPEAICICVRVCAPFGCDPPRCRRLTVLYCSRGAFLSSDHNCTVTDGQRWSVHGNVLAP